MVYKFSVEKSSCLTPKVGVGSYAYVTGRSLASKSSKLRRRWCVLLNGVKPNSPGTRDLSPYSIADVRHVPADIDFREQQVARRGEGRPAKRGA
jgi:hypothetical protein